MTKVEKFTDSCLVFIKVFMIAVSLSAITYLWQKVSNVLKIIA